MKFNVLILSSLVAVNGIIAGQLGNGLTRPFPYLKEFGKHFPARNSTQSSSLDHFIVGGVAAKEGQIPFQVAVLPDCGGSILSNNWIVTAAHCVFELTASSITIRYNSLYANSGGSTVGVATVVVHPNYDEDTFNNDIALLQTSSPITFGPNVQPIGLCAPGNEPTSNNLQVSGYGLLSDGGTVASSLRVVNVSAVSRSTCNTNYGGVITNSMFCAASPGKDSCGGDSGGPVMNPYNHLVGIVSFGISCADPNYPGVYTRVGVFVDWINTVMTQQNIDIPCVLRK